MPFCYLYLIIRERKDKRIIKQHYNTTPKNNRKAYLPASATLEASLVIPLYVYAVLAVAYMIQIISIKSSVMQALYFTARDMSGYAYIKEQAESIADNKNDITDLITEDTGDQSIDMNQLLSSGVTIAYADSVMRSYLGSDFAKYSDIVGGEAGISLLESQILEQNAQIKLTVIYMVQNPFDVFGIAIQTIEQTYTCEAWLGEEYETNSQENAQEETVYITTSGTVYHRNRNCTYLQFTIRSVLYTDLSSERNTEGAKYYPCEICGTHAHGDQVYVTEYGNRYHTTMNCSKLRRTVLAIPISQVGDRHACSKCGGG